MLYIPYPFKRCTTCGNEYLPNFANFSKSNTGQLTARCKFCIRAYQKRWHYQNRDNILTKKHAYIDANRETINAKKRADYYKQMAIDPEPIRARARKASKTWRDNNPEKAKVNDRLYKTNHRDEINQSHRQRYWKNPEYYRDRAKAWAREHKQQKTYSRHSSAAYRVIWLRYRARKRNLSDKFTADDWRNCLDYFNHRCAVCNRPIGLWHTLAADHWIPLSSPDCPGTVPENIIPLCHGADGCNNEKSNRNAEEWLNEKVGAKQAARILAHIQAYFAQVSSNH